MELPMISMAVVNANSNPDVMSWESRCYTTHFFSCGSWCLRTSMYVTGVVSQRAKIIYDSLLKPEFWIIHQLLIPYVWQLLFAIFLLRDGLLTLMKMVSLLDHAKIWSSLPTILKLSRGFPVFFESFSKCSA